MKREEVKRAPRRPAPRKAVKAEETKEQRVFDFKLFGKWDSNVPVRDIGLKPYMNLNARMLPRSAGIHREKFHKSKRHIVERLAMDLLVSGHSGKTHKLSSGKFGGGFYTVIRIVEDAFDIIEKKEKKNPIEVFIGALENAALREEIISFQMGSVTAREAVITAPQRRIDRTLRFLSQGSYKKSFNKKITVAEALADEIINAYKNSNQSLAVAEKERIEREASGAR